jgi:Ca2+-binding EF-hand superfamily protein
MEKMMKVLIVATATLIALSAVVAGANEPYFPRSEKRLASLDSNGDGRLSPEELAPVVKKRAQRLDANGDRQVSAAEIDADLRKRIESRRGRIMLLMDANKDGAITEAEMDQVLNDMFDKADTDDDGSVSFAEIQVFKRAQWRKAYLERRAN